MLYKKIILSMAVVLAFVAACNKNKLDKPALGQLDESKLMNRKGVEALLIGAYALLDGVGGGVGGWGSAASNWIYGSVCGSEAYTGSRSDDRQDIRSIEKFISTGNNWLLEQKWEAVFDGVQQANNVLRILPKVKGIPTGEARRIEAEARFLRAHYHFEAIKMWYKVPYVDERVTYDAGNYYLSNDTLIWPAVERDLVFAAENLPDIQSAVGRVNSYAAKAFLAKAYLFQRKFSAAQPLLRELIDKGVTAGGKKYGLVKYADNFDPARKNSEEAVFSVQMSVNDGAFGGNGNAGDELNFPMGGPGGCCGFFQPSQYLVNHFKTNAITGLPDFDNFNRDDVKSDEGLLSSDPFIPYAGTLDPRLDWTVGRRGIPYLDWGNHPGSEWIRDQNYSGPYSPKKNVYYKETQHLYSEQSGWAMLTANNVNLIRFADILLWAAEVETELDNPDKAREYVNAVRRRAANPEGWVKRQNGLPAANYKIGEYTQPWSDPDFARRAIRYERTLELAMEGHRFFDLVRWGIADKEINAYLEKEKVRRTYLNEARFLRNKHERFPIPQREIDLSAGPDGVRKLKQNPGY